MTEKEIIEEIRYLTSGLFQRLTDATTANKAYEEIETFNTAVEIIKKLPKNTFQKGKIL